MGIEVGQEAPDFTLANRDGEDVSLSSYRGQRNVVLIFYPLAFSGTCTKQFTEMNGNGDAYATSDAQVIAVSVDNRFSQGAFQDQLGTDHVLFLGDFEPKGAVAREYGVYLDARGHPTRASFVIDKAGIVRSAQVMAVPTDLPDEASYFEALAQCDV